MVQLYGQLISKRHDTADVSGAQKQKQVRPGYISPKVPTFGLMFVVWPVFLVGSVAVALSSAFRWRNFNV